MRRSVGIVIVLFVVAGVFAWGTAVWASHRATLHSATTMPAGLSRLGTPATLLDVLPPTIPAAKLGSGGIDPSSVRLIQAGTAGSFWVALDAGGDVCLIVSTGPGPTESGAGCVTPSVFEAHGLAYRLTSKGGALAEAYLLPDTVFTGSEASTTVRGNLLDDDGTVSFYDNLLLLNPAATKAQRAAVQSQLGALFAVDVLPPVG